jgi:acetyl esterase/lipase
MKRIVALATFIAILFGVTTQDAQAQTSTHVNSLPYDYSHSSADQSMTATYSTARTNAPWAILLHGGSWINGSQANMYGFASTFYNQGYQVFNLSYSVGPTVTFNDQLRDIVNARDYVKAHYGLFHLNPNRGVVVGFSAGGHLAASVGNLYGGFKAIVSASGVVQPQRFPEMVMRGNRDGEVHYIDSRAATMVGCAYTRTATGACGAAWHRFEPQYSLNTHTPATYVIQGGADQINPAQAAKSYNYWMNHYGVKHHMIVIAPGYGHTPAELFDSQSRVQAMFNFLHANGA